MKMVSLFNADAAPTWADPIEMLYACHGKVKRFCEQLNRLPAYLAEHGCNDATRQAIKQIGIYFNCAAPLHHADEEHDFFPALLRYRPEAQSIIAELEQQHLDLNQHWRNVAQQLQAILSGTPDHLDETSIRAFTHAYAQHIQIEEHLFEWGKQSIPPAVLQQLGSNMAKRRQINNPSS